MLSEINISAQFAVRVLMGCGHVANDYVNGDVYF